MPQLFAFLRAINAGPGRVVRMNVLRQAFESLGFSGVATFLGSGNVVFETRATDVGTLEEKIERRLERALGYIKIVRKKDDVDMCPVDLRIFEGLESRDFFQLSRCPYEHRHVMNSDLIPAMNEALANRVFISRLTF